MQRVLLLLALICLAPHLAMAQTAQDIANANRQSEQIQREQELRRFEQMQRDQQSASPPARLDVQKPAEPAEQASKSCRDIKTIQIKNATVLDEDKQQELIAPYVGRCLGVNEIQQLLSDITREYIDRGHATSRAYIPTQDLSTGVLQILVVEGKIGQIRRESPDDNMVSLDDQDDNVNLTTAFPGLEGEMLDIADLEQGIDQLNRLQSNHVTMELRPGATAGETDVVITNMPDRLWHVNTTLDDYGTESTGRSQVSATVSLDSPMGLNEYISYTRRESLPFRDALVNSVSNNVFVSVPFGYTTLSGGYSDSDYKSVLQTAGGMLRLTGDSYTIFGKLENTVYRHQADKLNLSSTLSVKEFNNFFAGQKLQVSSRRLTILDVDADYSTMAGGGMLSMGAGLSQGLSAFNAIDDQPGVPNGEFPQAHFLKVRLYGGYFLPFTIDDRNMSWSSQFSAQHSNRALYGSEQMSIGSIYTVRGFYNASIANDTGAYIRNDVAANFNVGDIAEGVPAIVRPYVGLDAGAVAGHVTGSPHGGIAGAAVGISLIAGPAFFDIYTSRALAAPSDMQKEGNLTFSRMAVTF